LKLITLNSLESIECFQNVTSKFTKKKRAFWTSGLFLDCEEDAKFSWCAVEEDFNSSQVPWGQGQPPLTKAGTCVSVIFEPGIEPYFEAIDCKSAISFICEVNIVLFQDIHCF
jgi:hypothetical protein